MTEAKQTTLAEIKAGPSLKPVADPAPGFFSSAGMSLLEKAANMLTHSDLVPVQYRSFIVEKNGSRKENPAGFSNCIVAVNMAQQIGLDPLTVMQNLHVIEGRPSWAATFIISRINNSGLFTRMAFDLSDPGESVEVEYKAYEGWGNSRTSSIKKSVMRHQTCRAWAKDKESGAILKGTEISVKMAIEEGWALKNGSKWHTMQEMMLQYRAASFWCRIHAPELLSGLPSDDELRDVIEAEIIGDKMQAKPVKAEDLRDLAKSSKKSATVAEDIEVNEPLAADSLTEEADTSKETQQPRQRRTRQAAFNTE